MLTNIRDGLWMSNDPKHQSLIFDNLSTFISAMSVYNLSGFRLVLRQGARSPLIEILEDQFWYGGLHSQTKKKLEIAQNLIKRTGTYFFSSQSK